MLVDAVSSFCLPAVPDTDSPPRHRCRQLPSPGRQPPTAATGGGDHRHEDDGDNNEGDSAERGGHRQRQHRRTLATATSRWQQLQWRHGGQDQGATRVGRALHRWPPLATTKMTCKISAISKQRGREEGRGVQRQRRQRRQQPQQSDRHRGCQKHMSDPSAQHNNQLYERANAEMAKKRETMTCVGG